MTLKLSENKKGFTLLELIISIAVFSIIIPAMAVGVRNLIQLNSRARNLAIANIVAESKAEELRGLGFNALPLGTTDMSAELPAQLNAPRSANYTIANTSPGIAEITLSVSFNDVGQTRTLTYKTIVSELGVGQ
jgi:prepilin-type N-terminal cleavage/methylation domain-containing protein